MKIIKDKETNIVLFAGDDLTLTADGAGGQGWRANNITPENAVLEEVEWIPKYFIGNGYTYENGVWNQTETGTAYEAEQTAKWKEEHNASLKVRLRDLIQNEPKIGDALDQLADIDKRVDLIVPVVLRLLLYVIEGIEMPPDLLQNYLGFAHLFLDAVDAGVYKDRADMEDPEVMIPKLMEQRTILASIVETEYKNKLI